MTQEQTVALVTGKLAEPALRRVASKMEADGRVRGRVVVLNIQVAALMSAEWVTRKLELPVGEKIDRVILPGHCRGDLGPLSEKLGVPVERGPLDLHDLPEMFGGKPRRAEKPDAYTIQIIAEINHAARTPMEAILAQAEAYRADGADVIDIGCDPQADRAPWMGVADVVRELHARDFRVSVDSFHPAEVAAACAAGAELVLSVNTTNAERAAEWGTEVVAIPDDPRDLDSLDPTIAILEKRGVKYRLDPVIEPIGMGFADSLGRYIETRRRYPDAAIMMGIGNMTEMTEVDSAGVNALLIGFCEELGIGSVLTTQVINWSRTAVREIDAARRLMHHAVLNRTPPKHADDRLVMLRDAKLRGFDAAALGDLARGLTDRNIRVFVEHAEGLIHVMNKDFHLTGDDPALLFDQMQEAGADLDPSHAFYIGHELSKALTALTLGKSYTQDRALSWGMLTRDEVSGHERRKGSGKSRRGKNAEPHQGDEKI
ncbi:MAG: DUF6513 domain-containing protein [Planctomycetes bacterium]|nr:DUF6513 domain-containing protein [Planctomycetota bacterium]